MHSLIVDGAVYLMQTQVKCMWSFWMLLSQVAESLNMFPLKRGAVHNAVLFSSVHVLGRLLGLDVIAHICLNMTIKERA